MTQWAKKELSILIPNYNNVCVELVRVLQQQAAALGIDYEIIVADDASPQKDTIRLNLPINELPHCRYIVKETNSGSAATRNYLGQQSQYHWLLFLDCDITIPDDHFLERYMADTHEGVVNGGICIIEDDTLSHNLRYIYEKDAEPAHTAEKRQANKYHEFRSTNFMIEREVFEACPFDERFKGGGYEDVMFGKQLMSQGIVVNHIDNPIVLTSFEDNKSYIEKTERNLRTLYSYRKELTGFSKFLEVNTLVRPFIRLLHIAFGALERKMLCGSHPRLWMFNAYRLGYYLTLKG